MAKFHGYILNLSENIAKSFGATFFDSHCTPTVQYFQISFAPYSNVRCTLFAPHLGLRPIFARVCPLCSAV